MPRELEDVTNEYERALILTEVADHAHVNCEECEGQIAAVLCEHCFPLDDAARLARRAALGYGEIVVSPATPDELTERVSGGVFKTVAELLDACGLSQATGSSDAQT